MVILRRQSRLMIGQRAAERPENDIAAAQVLREVFSRVAGDIIHRSRSLEATVAMFSSPGFGKCNSLASVQPAGDAQQWMEMRPTGLLVLESHNSGFDLAADRPYA